MVALASGPVRDDLAAASAVVRGRAGADRPRIVRAAAGRAPRRLPERAAADTPAAPQGVAARSRAATGFRDPNDGAWLWDRRRRKMLSGDRRRQGISVAGNN